jgi:hypothetical protein
VLALVWLLLLLLLLSLGSLAILLLHLLLLCCALLAPVWGVSWALGNPSGACAATPHPLQLA